jgi:AraC-like DNA-binding protein
LYWRVQRLVTATLARRMQSVLGKSPFAFVQDLRIAHAVHLLKTSRRSPPKSVMPEAHDGWVGGNGEVQSLRVRDFLSPIRGTE